MTELITWLQRHETTTELAVVWALAAGFGLFGLIKAVSWLALMRQRDQTMVGVSLKFQKGAEAVLGLAMMALYGLTLAAYHLGFAPTFWVRMAIRSGVFVAIVIASVSGAIFVVHLVQEASRKRKGTAPLALTTADEKEG